MGNDRQTDIYLLTATVLTPSDNSTVHIYTKTIHRTTQLIWEESRPWVMMGNEES